MMIDNKKLNNNNNNIYSYIYMKHNNDKVFENMYIYIYTKIYK